MHLLQFEYMIERELRDVVVGHFPLDWKEDVLTHELVRRFRRRFKHIQLEGLRFPLQVEWEIYKLHGPRETEHGDIGVLVLYRLPTGAVLEGAGFLEAKVRARDSTKFLQVREEQITRMLARSPQTRLLLYDYRPVAVLDQPFGHDLDWEFFLPHQARWPSLGRSRVTHGAVVPLELAAAVNQYDETLYQLSYSLSHQFSRRYFNLHDLDFSHAAVCAVKGFPGTLGGSNYIMVIRASIVGQELPEGIRPNDNLYGPFE
jgi:hypothetical protein